MGGIVRNTIVITKASDFAVVLVKNFEVIVVLEVVSGLGFPVFFPVYRGFNRHGPIVQQLFPHNIAGQLQAYASIQCAAQPAFFVPFCHIGATDIDVIPQKASTLGGMGYQRFLIRQLQLEYVCRKCLYLFFDMLCVLFTSNHPD